MLAPRLALRYQAHTSVGMAHREPDWLRSMQALASRPVEQATDARAAHIASMGALDAAEALARATTLRATPAGVRARRRSAAAQLLSGGQVPIVMPPHRSAGIEHDPFPLEPSGGSSVMTLDGQSPNYPRSTLVSRSGGVVLSMTRSTPKHRSASKLQTPFASPIDTRTARRRRAHTAAAGGKGLHQLPGNGAGNTGVGKHAPDRSRALSVSQNLRSVDGRGTLRAAARSNFGLGYRVSTARPKSRNPVLRPRMSQPTGTAEYDVLVQCPHSCVYDPVVPATGGLEPIVPVDPHAQPEVVEAAQQLLHRVEPRGLSDKAAVLLTEATKQEQLEQWLLVFKRQKRYYASASIKSEIQLDVRAACLKTVPAEAYYY